MAFLGLGLQVRRRYRRDLERYAGGQRVAHKMDAVKQQPRAGGIRFHRQLPKRTHDRILPARDRPHQWVGGGRWIVAGCLAAAWRTAIHHPLPTIRLCYSLDSTMKERILKRFHEEIAALER